MDPSAAEGLRRRAGFESFVLRLPAVSTVEQWEALVAKVGGKVFAMIGDTGGITFKVGETSFAGLTSLPGVTQAPYFARGGWVRIGPEAEFADADLARYLAEAHRLIAAKLTRRLRAELGLMG
jgi:predicted DNA-binding protein (MmcQ/YjbR family)